MGIYARHFHVFTVTPSGVVLYESEYDDAEQSIDDFIGLVTNIYKYQIGELPNSYKLELMNAAHSDDTPSVSLGFLESKFKTYWAVCDGECMEYGTRPGRN